MKPWSCFVEQLQLFSIEFHFGRMRSCSMLIHLRTPPCLCKMSTRNTNLCHTLLTISFMHIWNISIAILLGRHTEHHCTMICSEFLLSSCRCNSKCLYLTDVYLQMAIPATAPCCHHTLACRVPTFLLQNSWF
jgi:hypothetical protein